ncbi:MAG: stage II sporulation protein M [Caldilinea sp.]
MNLEFFLQQRRASWQRIEALLQQARTDPRNLSAPELNELGLLYRSITSDLALAQRDFPNQQVTRYLNQLVGRAHGLIYRGEPLRWRQLARFYRTEFPQLYRRLLPYTIAAFVLFLLPAVVAFWSVAVNPEWIYVIEGPGIAGLVAQVEEGALWTEIAPGVRSAAAGLIMTNNIQVMFLTFAGGLTAGLLTLWVLINNGLHLGAIFGLLLAHDLAGGLAEFVVAHGVVELSVIFLAGGCGLYVGDGLLRPGLFSRRDTLLQRTLTSVQLILGSAPLLVIAGIIEGFLSPSAAPWPVKVLVGIMTGVALYAYWLGAGRHQVER